MLEYFNKGHKVLDINYQFQKEKEEAELENFKKEYNLDKLAAELEEGFVPGILEFYFGGEKKVEEYLPNSKTVNFIDFLTSDFGSRIMRENNLFIHIESGNLYYNRINTGEFFYDFVVSKIDLTKKIIS